MKITVPGSSRSRALLIAVLAFSSCARNPGSTARQDLVTNPTAVSASSAEGVVSGSATGDVRSGPGVLEINAVRMDRQTSVGGTSILRQYANPGETYPINVGEAIELWVEWDRNIGSVPSGQIPNNPRLVVEWGDGDSDNIACGACKLYHIYRKPVLYPVKVKLDDRVNTTVTRSFFLDARAPEGGPFTLTIACIGEGCNNPYLGGGPFKGDPSITGPGISCGPMGGSCGPASFPAGTVVTLTAQTDRVMTLRAGGPVLDLPAISASPTPSPSPSPTPSCGITGILQWRGACAGIGTGIGRDSGSCTLTMNSNLTASVQIGAIDCDNQPGD